MSANYRYVLYDSHLKYNKGELKAVKSVDYGYVLNDYGEATVILDPRQNELKEHLEIGSTDLHIYRNGERIWGGEIIGFDGQITSVESNVTLRAVSYEYLLRQMITSGWNYFDGVEGGEILNSLLIQAQNDMGFVKPGRTCYDNVYKQPFTVKSPVTPTFAMLNAYYTGYPSGNLTFEIKRTSDDHEMASMYWTISHVHDSSDSSEIQDCWLYQPFDSSEELQPGVDYYIKIYNSNAGDSALNNYYIRIYEFLPFCDTWGGAHPGLEILFDPMLVDDVKDDGRYVSLVFGDAVGNVLSTAWLSHFGIIRGSIDRTLKRFRLYEYKKLSDVAHQFANINQGFDFEIDANKHLNIFYPRKDVYSAYSILRPGTERSFYHLSEIPTSGACGFGTQYKCGRDIGFNHGSAVYLGNSYSTGWAEYDISNLPSHLESSKIIPKLTFVIIAWTDDIDNSRFSLSLTDAGDEIWMSSFFTFTEQNSSGYADLDAATPKVFAIMANDNPTTGEPWTVDEVNNLRMSFWLNSETTSRIWVMSTYIIAEYEDDYVHDSQILYPSGDRTNDFDVSPASPSTAWDKLDDPAGYPDYLETEIYKIDEFGDLDLIVDFDDLETLPADAVIERLELHIVMQASWITEDMFEIQMRSYSGAGFTSKDFACGYSYPLRSAYESHGPWAHYVYGFPSDNWTETDINNLAVYFTIWSGYEVHITQMYVEVFYAYPDSTKTKTLEPFIWDRNLTSVEFVKDFGNPCNSATVIGRGIGPSTYIGLDSSVYSSIYKKKRSDISYFKSMDDASSLASRASNMVLDGKNTVDNLIVHTNGREVGDLLGEIGRSAYININRGVIDIDDYYTITKMDVKVDENNGESAAYTVVPARMYSPSIFDNIDQVRLDVNLALAISS